jgi:tetratricopeptide (TPR) repeat protein
MAKDPKNYPAHHDLGRLLIKLKRYDEAVPVLERGATLNSNDPGIHYQLFTAYSRLKRKTEAERELALFKQLEESRKKGEGMSGGSATGDATLPTTDALPPPATNNTGPKSP